MSDQEMTDEEVKQLLKQRLNEASPRVAMVAFADGDPPSAEGVDNNGTVSFLELPGGKFIVTNYHVWYHYQEQKKIRPNYVLALLSKQISQSIDISVAQLVSESPELDLCVLSYPHEIIESRQHKYHILKKPICRPVEGD